MAPLTFLCPTVRMVRLLLGVMRLSYCLQLEISHQEPRKGRGCRELVTKRAAGPGGSHTKYRLTSKIKQMPGIPYQTNSHSAPGMWILRCCVPSQL